MQAQRGEDRRGVEEHHHVRRRGVAQPLARQQKLQREQCPRRHARLPHAVGQRQALAPPGHPQPDEQRGHARAHCNLQQRRAVLRGGFEGDLLRTPDEAQHHHQAHGAGIKGIAGIHGVRLRR